MKENNYLTKPHFAWWQRQTTFLRYCIMAFAMLWGAGAYSQTLNDYVFTQTAETYTPITGGTVLWSGYDGFDDNISGAIPVSFVYQGVTYTSIFVSANGNFKFGITNTSNTPISSGLNAVAPFAVDLDAKSASAGTGLPEVRYEQVGDEFVVQWANVCRYTSSGALSAENMNFQARLNTVTLAIKIVYGDCVDRATPVTTYPQVGLGGGSATMYRNRTLAADGGDWINSAAGTTNTQTMAFNGTTIPSSGLTYTWIPTSCTGTPAPGNTLSSSTAACSGANFTLSLENPIAGSGASYQWESADDEDFTVNVTQLGTTATQVTSQTSAKYYRCTATCSEDPSVQGVSNPLLVTTTVCVNQPAANGSDSITLCSGNYYDTGGSSDPYNNNQNSIFTIYPEPGNLVQVTFNEFNVETGYDYLIIYDGENTNAPTINSNYPGPGNGSAPAGAWTGTNANGQTFTATNGSLTFRFFSDGSVTNPGWAATVSCITAPSCMSPTSLVVSNINSSGADFSWTASITTPADGYGWEVLDGDNNVAASGTTSGTSVTVNTLSPLTAYTFRVWAICEEGVDESAPISIALNTIATCLPPTNLTVQQLSDTSGVFSWTASVSNPADGYNWQILDSEGNVIDSGTTDELTASSSILTANTNYTLQVSSVCSDNDLSVWSAGLPFHTGYCEVTSTNTNYGIGNFTTTGGYTNINNPSSPGTYTDYTGQSVSTYAGGSVDFTISSVNTTATHGMGIWIDWNSNFSFSDPGEQVYSSGGYTNVGTGSITVPLGVPVGNYRMRVVANWLSTTPTPCGNLGNAAYGEAEDYTFEVIETPNCVPPTLLTATSTSSSSTTFSWTPVSEPPVNGYEYIISTSSETPTEDGAVTTETEVTVDDLEAATQYYFFIRNLCEDGETSIWVFVPFLTPISNDNCADAIAFPEIPTDGTCATVLASTIGATGSSDPTCGGTEDDDVWFTFTVPVGYSYLLYTNTTVSGNGDRMLQVFDACAGTSLGCYDPETGSLTGLTGGNTYVLRAYTYATGVTSTFNICLQVPPPPPANDECADAVAFPEITTDGICSTVTATTQSATGSADATCFGTEDDDVWFTFTVPDGYSSLLYANTSISGTSGDRMLQVFDTCGGTSLGCYDPETGTITGLTGGNTYILRAYTYGANVYSTFTICLRVPPPPPVNDDPCGAIALDISGECVYGTFSNDGATNSANSNIPAPGCAGYQGGDVWFTVTVPANGHVTADAIQGSLTDCGMAWYSGNACDSLLTLIECDDDDSPNGFMPRIERSDLESGSTLYIRFWDYSNNDTGTFGICVTSPCTAPGSPTVTTSGNTATATWTSAGDGSVYNWEVRESGEPGSGDTGLIQSGTTDADELSVLIENLSYASTYQFYVSTNCGDVTSGWSTPITFTTEVMQGCTDNAACNYNQDAMVDDGSCIFETTTLYLDADSDGYGSDDPEDAIDHCGETADGYVTNNTDCDDSDANVWRSDDFFVDQDGDGYTTGTETVCYGEVTPEGYATESLGTDCDDTDAESWLPTQVQVAIQLPVTTVCDNSAGFALTGGSPAGGTWSGTGVNNGQFNPSGLTAPQSYTVTYTVADNGDCLTGGSATATINVDDCTEIDEASANQIKLYPTFTNNYVTVVGAGLNEAVIMDMNGKRLNTVSLFNTSVIDMQPYAAGIYFIHVSSWTNTQMFKVVKMN